MSNMADNEIKIITNENNNSVNLDTYNAVRGYVVAAQRQINASVNSAMVNAYWNIGKQIYEACGESERTAFGIKLDTLS